jgi:hypothetical protein
MDIRLIRTVCIKASGRACCAGSQDSLLSATKGVASARFESISARILQAPEALLTLSFRLDLTIYRRYNPRT